MAISVGRYLKNKDYISVSKEVHKQKFATWKSLCNLQELYTAFKEKYPNVNIGFSKFCALRPKWCVLAGSKMTHPVCICSAHQKFVFLVDAVDWDLTYKDLIKLTLSCLKVRLPPSKKHSVIFLIGGTLKMMKNAFYCTLKALFILKIFKFCHDFLVM